MDVGRRSFFGLAAGIAAQATLYNSAIERASAAVKGRSPEEVSTDEDYWAQIRNEFTVDRNVINLNNGSSSPAPRIVQEAVKQGLDFANRGPGHTTKIQAGETEMARVRLAKMAGCDPEELAITRNASEALEIAQFGIDLKAGDEVLTTNQDYGTMLNTFRQREKREGIVMKTISFPVPPPSMDDLYQRFERAVTPKTKVILVCHITNTTGQIFPVQRICQMAHARNIPVIVDGAHAFNHFPYQISDLDCDYYGVSLHKWTLAPMGTGFLYVRKSRIKETWPLMAADDRKADNIRKFERIGTHSVAVHNAISEAVIFNESIGIDRKLARLRYLRDRWANRLAQNPNVRMLHSPDPAQSAGIGTFAVNKGDLKQLLQTLLQAGILTKVVAHAEFTGMRITPNIYSTVGDIDTFAAAVEKELKNV